jgi:hypothetical protein
MSHFTTALSQISQQEGLNLPLHASMQGNYTRFISPELEGFELLEGKKPGQPDYTIQAQLNGEMIFHTTVNHKDYRLMNLYKPARVLVAKIKSLIEQNDIQANHSSKKVFSWFNCPYCRNYLQFRGRNKARDKRQYYCWNDECPKYPAFFEESLYNPGVITQVTPEKSDKQANRFSKEIFSQNRDISWENASLDEMDEHLLGTFHSQANRVEQAIQECGFTIEDEKSRTDIVHFRKEGWVYYNFKAMNAEENSIIVVFQMKEESHSMPALRIFVYEGENKNGKLLGSSPKFSYTEDAFGPTKKVIKEALEKSEEEFNQNRQENVPNLVEDIIKRINNSKPLNGDQKIDFYNEIKQIQDPVQRELVMNILKKATNRFDKIIWAQVASGPRAEVIHKWNELITILRNQGDTRSTYTLNDLIVKTFSVGAFNQADFEEKSRMLDQLKEMILNRQETHASRNEELMNRFSSNSWGNKKGPNQDIFAQSYEDLFYRDMNWEPGDEEDEGLRKLYKEKYGQYFPDSKIMSKILKDHGLDYSDYDSEAPNVKEHYNIDRFFDWLGY